jgi:NAD(P)-dependent dehydrogenase (short-subunit alcohol dehydrogenase family)
MTTITGYKQDTQGTYIVKDRLAELTYSMDWTEWLPQGVTVTAVSYTLTNPTYNPTPMTISTSGVSGGNVTFVVLAAGTAGKIYTVTAQITLDNSQIDRRNFRVKVENRSA